MLNLFQPIEVSNDIDLKSFLRQEINQALNKGIILEWSVLLSLFPQDCDPTEVQGYYESLVRNRSLIEELKRISFTEIYLHGPNSSRYQDLDGRKNKFSINIDEASWQVWLEIIAITYLQNWNCENPFVSFRVEIDGHPYRFSLLHYSATSSAYSTLVIRNLQLSSLPLSSFINNFDLKNMIHQNKNILICGGTGSGKTSLLNTLLRETSPEEHLVVLEDTQEIILPHNYCTRFLSQKHQSYSLENFLTYTLRLSPERIVLGEIRSSEVVSYLLAMNTGHRGVLSTIHANSCIEGLYRLQMLTSLYGKGLQSNQIMKLVCQNIDYVIFMENKKVKEIIKPLGEDQGHPYFETLFQA